MNPEIKALKDTAEYARMMYRLGAITREEAAERIKPYADAFNAKSREIAKKYNQKPGKFSLAAYLRRARPRRDINGESERTGHKGRAAQTCPWLRV